MFAGSLVALFYGLVAMLGGLSAVCFVMGLKVPQ